MKCLPIDIQEAIANILALHPEYYTKEGATGQCLRASDLLLFELDIMNGGDPIDGVAICTQNPVHYWVYIPPNINIDLTARQFNENDECPKIWFN